MEKISKRKEAGIEGFGTVALFSLIQGRPVVLTFGRLLGLYGIELKLPQQMLDKTVQMNLYLTKEVADKTFEVAL